MLVCPICKKEIKDNGGMSYHFKIIHKSDYIDYLLTHNLITQPHCKICGNEIDIKTINSSGRRHITKGEIPLYCSNKCKFKDKNYNKKRGIKSIHNDTGKKCICNICGDIFNDINNISGALTTHLKKHNIDEYYKNYFNIVDYIDDRKKWKCNICGWETIDIDNKSGFILTHITNIHQIDDYQIWNKLYPKNKIKVTAKFLNKKNINIERNKYGIKCEICGKYFKTISSTHLKLHNITQKEYKRKYKKSLICKKTSKILSLHMTEMNKHMVHTRHSKPENEIRDFLREHGLNIVQGNRKILDGKEIDLLEENLKIGIEHNGNIHHTEIFGGKDKYYHLNKLLLANSKGYNLLHIFQDEWEYKQDIVKYKLLHIFKKSNAKIIYARKCILKDNIDIHEKNEFLINNHIQGKNNSKTNIGAYYNNELVAIMSLDSKRNMSKSKSHTENTWELTRFCVKNGYIISGIADRLLKLFIKLYNPKNIISFADRRWTMNKDNNIYTKLGFNFIKILKPDYSYYNYDIDEYKRFHKFGFGKKQLKKKFPEIYDDSKTEWQMMQELGYDRIWDCGKFKYELIVNK